MGIMIFYDPGCICRISLGGGGYLVSMDVFPGLAKGDMMVTDQSCQSSQLCSLSMARTALSIIASFDIMSVSTFVRVVEVTGLITC